MSKCGVTREQNVENKVINNSLLFLLKRKVHGNGRMVWYGVIVSSVNANSL